MKSNLSQANVDGDSSSDQFIAARKSEFYKELDKRIAGLTPEPPTHILTGESFREIYNFMKSIKDVSAKMRINIMKSYPNDIAYKWMKKYDMLTIDTSNVLVYKQVPGAALDIGQKVHKYSIILDAIRIIHEIQVGGNNPK